MKVVDLTEQIRNCAPTQQAHERMRLRNCEIVDVIEPLADNLLSVPDRCAVLDLNLGLRSDTMCWHVGLALAGRTRWPW